MRRSCSTSLVLATLANALTIAANEPLAVRSDFPGGSIVVEKIDPVVRSIRFIPSVQADPAVDKTCESWAAHEGRASLLSLTWETPWNTLASTQAGYPQTGAQLGRCLARYLSEKL